MGMSPKTVTFEEIERRLRKFEKKYNMISSEFEKKYHSGELLKRYPPEAEEWHGDFLEWAGEYRSYRRILQQRIQRAVGS
jgi:hypothetical protein